MIDFETFSQNMDVLLFKLDKDGHLFYASEAWERLLYWRVEEILGRHFSEFFHPNLWSEINRLLLSVVFNKEKPLTEVNIRDFNGRYFPFTLQLWNIGEDEDLENGIAGFAFSSRKIIKSSNNPEYSSIELLSPDYSNLFSVIFQKSMLSVILINKIGLIIDVNPFHLKIFSKNKHKKKDFIGKNILEFDFPESIPIKGYLKRLIKGEDFLLIDQNYGEENDPNSRFHIQGISVKNENNKIKGSILLHYPVSLIGYIKQMRGKMHKLAIEIFGD